MKFNEDSRVKIPALLHLVRLGYKYIPKSECYRNSENNIFTEIFKESISRINPTLTGREITSILDDINLKLDYDDLGKEFYKYLSSISGVKLFDYKDISNNSFHVTTELIYKNGNEEFRPDITIIINGMPLIFIEVKKPNNKNGILEERKRINQRFQNEKFKRFANITQLMIFSNNMEYEDGVIEPIQGAYYATPSKTELTFNYFREEENLNLTQLLSAENESIENLILKDNNLSVIKYSPEFAINKHYNTPTNRILTSLLSKKRISFMLRYAIAYVEEENEGKKVLQKHIMRYPQLFATKAIEQKLDEGIKKGIIWHTQGSGKTALAYYNVRFLTDYYQKKNIIPKFYFIVDRLDLAIQASTEFRNRGLTVRNVNSRLDFINDMKRVGATLSNSGEDEISVVNIQKFTEESIAIKDLPYDINIQRIYFLDEAHRSYNPKGNYLANLINSDKDAIKIALTGTPLLREVVKDYDSKLLFGNYIHKYYYNMSIADGYTLRLIREGIDTTYKIQMQEVLEQIKILEGAIEKKEIFAHKKFVEPMLNYIIKDLAKFRSDNSDDSLGAMVVCDSSEQAKMLFKYFEAKYGRQRINNFSMVAESSPTYGNHKDKPLKGALILHDINTKDDRKEQVKQFKAGNIDILFVYNMLLTGFDAKRLKKLYLARVVQDHNLLQTLTRVNRPYKKFKYGYVVDFADITKAFNETNDNYLKELKGELGDEIDLYSNLFKSQEEIDNEIEEIKDNLFRYDINNAEIFDTQISEIKDQDKLRQLVKSLQNAKELKNIIRLQGYEELLDKLDFNKLNRLLQIAQAQLSKLNLIERINTEVDTTNLLNTALEDVIFLFTKVSEHELKLVDELTSKIKQVREALLSNFDAKDPSFVSLKDELERILKNSNIEEVDQELMHEHIQLLQTIYDRVSKLNRENDLLKAKYEQDEKYARIHKRLLEKGTLSVKERQLYEALVAVKNSMDEQLSNKKTLITNEEFFKNEVMSTVIEHFIDNNKINLDFETTNKINDLIIAEYYNEYRGIRQ